jgi:hypothetical protein
MQDSAGAEYDFIREHIRESRLKLKLLRDLETAGVI